MFLFVCVFGARFVYALFHEWPLCLPVLLVPLHFTLIHARISGAIVPRTLSGTIPFSVYILIWSYVQTKLVLRLKLNHLVITLSRARARALIVFSLRMECNQLKMPTSGWDGTKTEPFSNGIARANEQFDLLFGKFQLRTIEWLPSSRCIHF